MFTKEPAVVLGAIAEIIKAIVPTLIIFGIIHWTDVQTAQVMLLVGVVVGSLNIVLTRSQVMPGADVNALIRTAVNMPSGTPVEAVKAAQEVKDTK